MQKKMHKALLASTAFALVLAVGAPSAQAGTSVADLQKQIVELQKQLDSLKSAQAETQKAVETVKAAPAADVKKGLKVTYGGILDAVGIYRSKNVATDTGTSWNSIPFANLSKAHEHEMRMSARNTRLFLKGEGAIDKDSAVTGYIETDFSAAGYTSNNVATNSYLPRLRQAYTTYDRNDLGLRFLVGQAWSMATPFKAGVTNGAEAAPPVADAGVMPGFTYARLPQARVVKSFDDKKIAAALAIESPEINFGGITAPATANIYNTGVGTSASVTYSTGYVPDVLAKVAFDPGYGHYELLGIYRTFNERIVSSTNKTYNAMSGGANAIIPVVPKYLDLQAAFLGGQSIGRYTSSSLPDISFNTDGTIDTVDGMAAMLGVTGHVTPTFDLYLYGGLERAMRNDETTGGTSASYGYGSTTLNLNGCETEGGTCNAQTRQIWQLTGGFWKDIYKGDYGRLQTGIQQSFTHREAFSGSGNVKPTTDEHITLVDFRFFPTF